MVRRKDNSRHQWFPGPSMVHRRERLEDFEYFWQSVAPRDKRMENVAVLGSDECKELYKGIGAVAKQATILLGIEHVEKNVMRKLDDLHFPKDAQLVIKDNLFGPNGLIECDTLELFDERLPEYLVKSDDIGKMKIKNYSNKFSNYFADTKPLVSENT